MPSVTLKKAFLKAYRIIASPRVIKQDRLLVLDEATSCVTPIFLIGLHRSGTTLMRQIIDSHSNIACPPETFFLNGLQDAINSKDFLLGLSGMGFERADVIKGLKRSCDFFYEAYRQSKGKGRWADKTPQYIWCLPFIEEMYGPNCQYIMIYRHPLDVCHSLQQKGWSFADLDADPFLNTIKYVKEALLLQEAFEAEHLDRVVRIRYEDLMSAPEPSVRRVLDFLGEAWESDVLNYGSVSHDFGTGDPEALLLNGFRPNVGAYLNWSQSKLHIALEHLGEQIVRLGYSVDA